MWRFIIRRSESASAIAREMAMRRWTARYAAGVLLAILLMCAGAAAEIRDPLPDLGDPLDQRIQRLSVMSQRDAAFEGVIYNNGYLSARGCQPVSLANALIAVLGIEDEQIAAGLVRETADLLVIPNQRNRMRIELGRIPMLLSTEERRQQEEEYPFLARTVGAYRGCIQTADGQLDADMLLQFANDADGPFVLTGRMTVYPAWTELLNLIACLHEMGRDDALVCLANVGAGTQKSGAPLSLGESGHYLTVMMHVGTFMQEGRIYVLDSLPRALEGETSGYEYVLRSPYPFTQRMKAFNETLQAARIRETVIKLTMHDRRAWSEAGTEIKAKMLGPLILYGPGVVMISVP